MYGLKEARELIQQVDVLLLPLLRPLREPDSESDLAHLIAEHAAPIIKGIIRSKLESRGGDHASVAFARHRQSAINRRAEAAIECAPNQKEKTGVDRGKR